MNPNHHLDLVALTNELTSSGAHKPLVAAVNRAAAIGSIREDLRNAASSLQIIRKMQCDLDGRAEIFAGNDDYATIVGALFTNAIILYSRATFTSGARPGLLGEDNLSTRDKDAHREVKNLRNTTVAHFGRGEDATGGPIVREAVVRSFDQKQYRYGVYTTRALHKVGLAARMESLIEARLGQVSCKLQGLLDEVEKRLHEAMSADEVLGRSLPRYAFDADRFCASSAAAAHMRAKLASGNVSDTDYTTAVPNPKIDD